MDINEIKPNSHKYKESLKENKKIEKSISGTAIKKKKSGKRKFADLFLAEDIKGIKDYILSDIIIPAIKDTIVDTIRKATEMLFYGEVRNKSTGTRFGATSYTSYSSFSRPNSQIRQPRSVYDMDDIILESRDDVENVLDILGDALERYGQITVEDYYDAVGVTGNGYTDRQYGWKDLKNVTTSRVAEGWLINMPRPKPID